MATTTETRRIKVEIKGDGSKELRRLSKGFKDLSRSSKRTSGVLGRAEKNFTRFFAGTLAGIGIKSVVNTADSLQLLRDRIKVFEGDSADATFVKLAEAADFTKTSIDNIAESYNRLALATKDLGLSSNALIGLTTALQQSFRLSGSTTAEAAAATIQLSQGLASGQLRGQELRSVLEQNAVIGEILAKTFKTARGNLIKFAESGKITSEVVLKALAENAEELNAKAAELGQTFSQTLTVSMNKFNLQVDKLNKTFGLNSAFAKGMEGFIDSLDELFAILAGIVAAKLVLILAGSFASLTLSMQGTTVAAVALRAVLIPGILIQMINPIGLLVTAVAVLTAGLVWMALNWKKSSLFIVAATGVIIETVQEMGIGILEALAKASSAVGANDFAKKLTDSANSLKDSLAETKEGTNAAVKGLLELEKSFKKKDAAQEYIDALKKASSNLKQVGDPTVAQRLADLNRQWLAGTITLDNYNKQLLKIRIGELNKQFKDGKKDLASYTKEMDKLTGGSRLAELNRQFEKGALSVTDYSVALNQIEVDRLKKGVEEGTVSVLDLNKALLSTQETVTSGTFKQGLSDYVTSVGTLAENVSGAISNTFGKLEDTFVEFIQTGKFNFKSFTKSILEDLQRIIVRQLIIRQLANAVGSAIGGPTGAALGGAPVASANGNAFGSGGVIPFADGGVVNSPTTFGISGGQTGLMGEAGPEAILPLSRGSDGKLGVKSAPSNVVVNVVNNSKNSDVSQRESTDSFGNKTIDIMIHSKVKEGITNGTFDKTFKQSFGIDRRGL